MDSTKKKLHKVFLIAGSEPLGTSGIQADIKAVSACGGYAAGAVTCIVDEDTTQVKDICMVSVEMVQAQSASFLEDVGADCIKTGMLYTKDMVQAVAGIICKYADIPSVIDPVMVSSAGDQLLEDESVQFYKDCLFPHATIITPNCREAEVLLGRKVDIHSIRNDLKELSQWGNAVIVKSIPENDYLSDCFYNPTTDEFKVYSKRIIDTKNVNGTGDSFASAIATYLAKGYQLVEAIDEAEKFIDNAIYYGAQFKFGTGYGPVYPFYKEYMP